MKNQKHKVDSNFAATLKKDVASERAKMIDDKADDEDRRKDK